ncbi:hypothetical protein GCM10023324_26790 [Streptomyces youssoufiensis]
MGPAGPREGVGRLADGSQSAAPAGGIPAARLAGLEITNDLDNHENPVEVSAHARHHPPGYTMSRYGRRRAEAAKKLVASSASRFGLATLV